MGGPKRDGLSFRGARPILAWLARAPRIFAGLIAALTLPETLLRAEEATQETLANTIEIIGHRRENQREQRAGTTHVYRPEQSSRQDVKVLLGGDASLTTQATGRPSASGYTVPRIRGQDARLTEVWVGRVKISDPYTGLPMVDDLDLRAFGELAVHLGTTPVSLPSVSPMGALELRFRPIQKTSTQLGAMMGDVHGSSVWTLVHGKRQGGDERESTQWRLYARRHVSSGKYRYYDDHATPYNEKDDHRASRQHNDRASWLLLPHVVHRLGAHRFEVFAYGTQSATSLPAPSERLSSEARERQHNVLLGTRWDYETSSLAMGPDRWALSAAIGHDQRQIQDPGQALFSRSDTNHTKIAAQRLGGEAHWEGSSYQSLLAVEAATARIVSKPSDSRLERRRSLGTLYAGLEATPWSKLSLELKAEGRQQRDEVGHGTDDRLAIDAEGRQGSERATKAASAALAWHSHGLQPYLQMAQAERAPSLLEQYGDGASVRGNFALKSELARHLEAGVHVRHGSRWEGGVALFQDRHEQRITFVPAVASTMRAQNLGATRTVGGEAKASLGLGPVQVSAAYCALNALELSDPDRPRKIPGIAEKRGALGLEYAWDRALFLRWQWRHQSELWRDPLNTIQIPAADLHDASLDLAARFFDMPWQLSWAVENVFDLEDVPISAGSNRGRTAHADASGYPLPGRQWRVSLTAAF